MKTVSKFLSFLALAAVSLLVAPCARAQNNVTMTNTNSLNYPLDNPPTGTFTMEGSQVLTGTISGTGSISISGSITGGTYSATTGSFSTLSTSTLTVSGNSTVNTLSAGAVSVTSGTNTGNGTVSGSFTVSGSATLAGGATVTGSATTQTISTGALTVGASGTKLLDIITFSVSASGGVATITNAAVTATSVPLGWGIMSGTPITTSASPVFAFNTGSFTATVQSGDTRTYSITIGVK